jgi:hypothetical protein
VPFNDCFKKLHIARNYAFYISPDKENSRGRGSISKVEGNWPKGVLLYMTKTKRFYIVHEPNKFFGKYGVSIMLEMTFTESLLEKRALFSLLKSGGAHAPIAPPPGSATPGEHS